MTNVLTVLDQIDDAAAAWAAQNVEARHIPMLRAVTQAGGTESAVVAGLAAATINRLRTGGWAGTQRLLVIVAGQNLLHNGIKLLARRRRPSGPHHSHFAGSSFPSGHTTTAAAVWPAVTAAVGAPRGVRAASYAVGPVVGATRVLLGVHWITDVTAGLGLGWLWLWLGRRFTRRG